MSIRLSEGAIAILRSNESSTSDLKPILQVTDLWLVNSTSNQNNQERYRLLLSDGIHFQQAMLATQKNDLVRENVLQKGSLVMITQFVCNMIQKRMTIIIIDLNVIVDKCDPIGETRSSSKNSSTDAFESGDDPFESVEKFTEKVESLKQTISDLKDELKEAKKKKRKYKKLVGAATKKLKQIKAIVEPVKEDSPPAAPSTAPSPSTAP